MTSTASIKYMYIKKTSLFLSVYFVHLRLLNVALNANSDFLFNELNEFLNEKKSIWFLTSFSVLSFICFQT